MKLTFPIRYIDEDQLVVNLKKCDRDLKWPDVMESWESLTKGILQLLKGTSIYIVGDSTEINENVGSELATGIGYGSSILIFFCSIQVSYPYIKLPHGNQRVAEALN